MTSKACPLRHQDLLQSSATAADQTVAVQQLADHIATAHTAIIQTPVDQTPVDQTPSALHYSDPQAIYQRYIRAREDWYKAQPRGSLKTNQQYRKAMGLPQRYKKSRYEWCLDYKYMGQRCRTSTGVRDWTKEEMMAYLDWTEAEDNGIEAQVAAEMESNRWSRGRRGMDDIWGRPRGIVTSSNGSGRQPRGTVRSSSGYIWLDHQQFILTLDCLMYSEEHKYDETEREERGAIDAIVDLWHF